ncbi:MAG: LacI family DNA-binding transcriptional regulator [Oscillospiraceae bacterium]|nr:LacI family DNA-binding transcriptional regulator [Oscillospiraceae bacterium]
MKRTTIKDVAREAGVSLSTVNKALTGKKGISKELKQKVLDTVERLDYKINRVAGSLARSTIRIGIIIPSDWEDYYSDICDGIAYEMDNMVDLKVEGVTLKYATKEKDSEKQVLDAFRKMEREKIRAIIFCHDNYSTYESAVEFATRQNITVICIGIGLRDRFAKFSTVIEIDAYKCGRIAAEYLENCLPENSGVAVMLGSKSVMPHAEKLRGFSDRIKESGKLRLCATIETEDDDRASESLTYELIRKKKPDGIYVATGAVSGVCRAVSESGKAMKIIATDLSADCRNYIKKDIVSATLYQNTFAQGIVAVDMLYKHFSTEARLPEKLLVAPVLFTRECLPEEGKKVTLTTIADF